MNTQKKSFKESLIEKWWDIWTALISLLCCFFNIFALAIYCKRGDYDHAIFSGIIVIYLSAMSAYYIALIINKKDGE